MRRSSSLETREVDSIVVVSHSGTSSAGGTVWKEAGTSRQLLRETCQELSSASEKCFIAMSSSAALVVVPERLRSGARSRADVPHNEIVVFDHGSLEHGLSARHARRSDVPLHMRATAAVDAAVAVDAQTAPTATWKTAWHVSGSQSAHSPHRVFLN